MSEAHDLLAGKLNGDPERTLLIHHGRTFTRGELNQDVTRFAEALRADLKVGDLLAIWLPNGPALLALLLASFQTGVVPMPLSPGLKWPEVKQILQRSHAVRLVTSAAATTDHAGELSECVEKIWTVPPGASPYPPLCGPAPKAPVLPIDPSRLTLVLHTSGSSGLPKGVMLSYESLRHILEYRLGHCDLNSGSTSVVASCVSQTLGLYQSLALLAAGAMFVLLDSYDVEAMLDAIEHHAPTHLILVVDAWDQLLHHPRLTAKHIAPLRFACAGGDRVTPRVQERFRALSGRPMRCSYGLTESSWALVNSGAKPEKCLALGKPCPGIQVRLLDPNGTEVAPGEVGQVHIQSPRNLLGYLHDEAATKAVLVGGWLATGDLAYQDREGDFWFAGRSKDLIVLATGANVSPAEVEAVLCTHPAVAACLIVGKATPAGSPLPWAYVIPAQETTPEALQAYLRERLSDYKVPAGFEFVSAFPIGLSGKIQRSEQRL